ncbi:MAG: type II toxin-antitoxin system mRNA interferase toxin, RelE/StbE family [Candidatus Caenarcaniphilales bacterium]|nr:type II toxin-antitoxin system mRNA interferase toxin, RelE/StbE family [Candidatus Caenarcaniphilales bacterium]
MYKLIQAKSFTRKLKKLIEKRRLTIDLLKSKFQVLAIDPFHKSLRTHKVNTRKLGYQYSSSIEGDLRIIWNFDSDKNLVILLLDIGGHSGSSGIY